MNPLTMMKQPNHPRTLVLESFEAQHWTVPLLHPRPTTPAASVRKSVRSRLTPPRGPRVVTLEMGHQP